MMSDNTKQKPDLGRRPDFSENELRTKEVSKDILQSSVPPVKKKSKVSRLFEILAPYAGPDDTGNYWAECPWCGSRQLNFSPSKWLFYCYQCDAGRGMNLTDLMRYLRIE